MIDYAPPPSSEWPFIGRTDELGRIAGARRRGIPGIVLLAGAGVGKSRLARLAVDAAERDGAHVAWVQATRSAAAVPLGACTGIIPRDAQAEDALGLMRATAAALRDAAGDRPVVLGVDDAQLLDPTSAALILHVALTGVAFVLATVRNGETRPDAVDALWKDAGLELLDLGALDEAQTAQVVEAALASPAEERVRRWAFNSSRGNLLYVRELLAGALADGALEDRGRFWCLVREPPPSASLAELVGARLEGIAGDERRSLELLALAEPLPLGEVMELAGAEPLAAVEGRGLIVAEGLAPDSPVRLSHPLYGEVVRASMSSLHARATRLRIAEVVQARPRRGPDDQLRVARWLLDAGAPVPPDVAVEAAGAANLAGDPELGGRLAELAFAGPHKPEAALQLARAHAMRKQFAEAEAVLADAEEQFTDQELALRALEHRVTLLYWALHRPADALAFIERAATRWSDHAWRARVESVRLYLLIWSEPALVIDATAAQLGHPATPDDVRPRLSIVRAGALFYAGRGREAHALARPLRPAIPLAATHEQITFDDCAMIDLETAEDLVETERWLSDSLAAAVASRDDVAAGLAAWSLAELCRLTARLDDAERWIAEATAQFSRRDPFGYLSLTHALAAGIALERDDYETAAAASARSAETIPGSVIDVPEQPNRARADAWALLAAGDAAGALMGPARCGAARRSPALLDASRVGGDAIRRATGRGMDGGPEGDPALRRPLGRRVRLPRARCGLRRCGGAARGRRAARGGRHSALGQRGGGSGRRVVRRGRRCRRGSARRPPFLRPPRARPGRRAAGHPRARPEVRRADTPRGAVRRPRRLRPHQRGDRRPPHPLRPHRRVPPLPRDAEARGA